MSATIGARLPNRHEWVVGVDPGLTSTGVAIFAAGTLASALEYTPKNRQALLTALAEYQRTAGPPLCWHRIVIEFPQIYRASRSKARPSDLMKLAHFVGQLNREGHAELVTPKEWSGGTPKATKASEAANSVRAKRIRAALSEAEAELVDWRCDDVIDAVGIGLWALGRLELKRRYPGATED